jgi:hypothetical protein
VEWAVRRTAHSLLRLRLRLWLWLWPQPHPLVQLFVSSAQQGQLAVAEFQKILDHRGPLWNCATGALAHLGLARAYAVQGDTAKAKAAYQDFLALWKDADPNIPTLIAAKSEYAKLQ